MKLAEKMKQLSLNVTSANNNVSDKIVNKYYNHILKEIEERANLEKTSLYFSLDLYQAFSLKLFSLFNRYNYKELRVIKSRITALLQNDGFEVENSVLFPLDITISWD